MKRQLMCTILFSLVLPLALGCEQKVANLGDFKLASGETILDCQIGYRTYGTLNAQKSNAVLWPTWFTGTSEDLAGLVGDDKFVDSTRYFVITVDALGNGVSSSPSNSKKQAGKEFPEITIRDMVDSQHRLLTKHLGIKHLHAVMGISMGGMQTFQWLVSYPDFMDKAVPIVGTTTQTASDLMMWNTQLQIMQYAQKSKSDMNEAMKLVGSVHELGLSTPADVNRQTSRDQFTHYYQDKVDVYPKHDANDWARQLKAMMSHDVFTPFKGNVENTAAAVKASVLVVISEKDLMVNPEPARSFAQALGCNVLELHGSGGHSATGGEDYIAMPVVREFLEE